MVDYSEAIEELRQFRADRDARRAAALNGWTPTSERLPERTVPVLACAPGYGVQVAFIINDKDHEWWYWGTSGCMGFTPTHWRPLPGLPS